MSVDNIIYDFMSKVNTGLERKSLFYAKRAMEVLEAWEKVGTKMPAEYFGLRAKFYSKDISSNIAYAEMAYSKGDNILARSRVDRALDEAAKMGFPLPLNALELKTKIMRKTERV